MKHWRPKGFYAMLPMKPGNDYIIESVADAMLAALRKDGLHVDISDGIHVKGHYLYHTQGTTSLGKLVFIPDNPPEEKPDLNVSVPLIYPDQSTILQLRDYKRAEVVESGYFCPKCGKQIRNADIRHAFCENDSHRGIFHRKRIEECPVK